MRKGDHKIGRREDYQGDRRDAVREYVTAHPQIPLERVAEHFGVSRALIQRYLKQLGIKRRPANKRLREKVDLLHYIAEDYEQAGFEFEMPTDADLLETVRRHEELVRNGEREF